MVSEYVLLCAPYRFENRFVGQMSKELIETELLSVVLPNVNILTRQLVKRGLKKNFGIVNKETLETEIKALERGDYQAIDSVEEALQTWGIDEDVKTPLKELVTLTKDKGIQGFDDCRIIDTLTKAYAGKIITKEEFDALFEEHTNRIKNTYDSWEQYLASCVVGKLFQFARKSSTVVTQEEFVLATYGYCIAPVNAFSYASFWTNHNLENLGETLAKLIGFDFKQDKEDFAKK